MSFYASRHMNMHSYRVHIGRLMIVVTNRIQLFEECKLPSVYGWWVKVVWCKKLTRNKK